MGLFNRTKNSDRWLAIVMQQDGLAACSVMQAPGQRPVVELSAFFADAANAGGLEKVGKELRASAYRCTTLLSGGQYQLLSTDAPNVAASELKTAVRWRLKDLIDFPADEATIDVLDIPLDHGAAVRPQRTMFVVAARNSAVSACQELFAAAKVRLSAIDIPEMAQRNIAALIETQGRGLAMLSLGDEGGLLTVTYGGELYLSRRIDISLPLLTDPDFERRNQGFDRITLELQRSLDNLERQFSFISVARLVLAPVDVPGLEEYLSSNLYTPVETLDLSSVFDLERAPDLMARAAQQRFFLPLGAALRAEETPK